MTHDVDFRPCEAMMEDEETLWTGKELAAFLGYSPTTIASMATKLPHRLPPRVVVLGRLRWVPSVVRQWVIDQSVAGRTPVRLGRPRKTPQID
jgi:hypothetical protein